MSQLPRGPQLFTKTYDFLAPSLWTAECMHTLIAAAEPRVAWKPALRHLTLVEMKRVALWNSKKEQDLYGDLAGALCHNSRHCCAAYSSAVSLVTS